MAATAAFWKAASGFDSSADENCRNSFSRDSLGSSATAARTWCCTAELDSAPKWRSSTRVTWPLSGPKACSSCVLSSDTTDDGRVLEVLLEDLDRRARLLAVEHPGPDLDRVGDQLRGILAGVGAGADELGGQRVVDHEVLDDHAADERGDAGVAQGCSCGFHDLVGG